MSIFPPEFRYFLIVSGQGSSAVKTRDCWARGRSRRKCRYFLRNFNAFRWSRQRSRLVLGAVRAEMLVPPMEFQYFLIVSGQGSSAVKTRDCWARGRSRRKCRYFLRNFNAFRWSRQRSRLVLGAVRAEMLVFPMEFQYFLIVSGQGSSAVKARDC